MRGHRQQSMPHRRRSGNRYEGEWRSGRKNGQGTYYYTSGDKYVGDFARNRATPCAAFFPHRPQRLGFRHICRGRYRLGTVVRNSRGEFAVGSMEKIEA